MIVAGGFSRWDEALRAWMSDPEGRLLIALCFFSLTLLAVLLVVVPLITRSIRLTYRRLVQGVEEIRRRGPAQDLPADIDGEARDLVASLNHLLGELRERITSLEQQRGSMQGILDSPRDYGLIATNREGLVLFMSAGASALLGYSAVDLVGRSVEVLFQEEDWNRLVPKLARRSLQETGLVQRVSLLRKDGTSFSVSLSVSGTTGRDSSMGFVCIFRDLTEQAVLERRLAESEGRHRSLVEGIQDGVVVLQAGHITYANSHLTKILGRPASELTGRLFKDFIAAEDLLLTLDRLEKLLSGGDAREFDLRFYRAGSSLPVETHASFWKVDHQGSPALMGTLRDETERRRFERDLSANRTLLDAALDSTSEGVIVVGIRGGERRATLVNRRAELLLGVHGRDILAWTEEDLHREIAKLCARSEDAEAFAAGKVPEAAQASVVTLLGPENRILELSAGPVGSPGAGVAVRIYSFQDVTERRRAEENLRESHQALVASRRELEATVSELQAARASLASRNEQLEKLNQELKSLDEMKSNLLANVSHELQTPLVLIKGYTEMILKRKIGPITPEQEKGLNVALRNIDRLVEMIDGLLDFSKIERGEAPLQLEEFPLWQVIDEVIELVREKIRARNLYVTTQYEADDLSVKADRGKISQIFINLLTNAIKFNREGGRVIIRVVKGVRGMLDVEVQDTGIGIPPEEQSRIFDRFYQVDSSSRKRYEGTGIGLSIVKDILSMHGCTIRVESRVGEGTTFAFNLPLGRSHSPGSSPRGDSRQATTRNKGTNR